MDKDVVVKFTEGNIVTAVCHYKGSDVCDECKLRFDCYLHENLIIEAATLGFKKDKVITEPLTELTERYLRAQNGQKEEGDDDMVVTVSQRRYLTDEDE